MARDLFKELQRCHYCDRRATMSWDEHLQTCAHEICMSLAFAERRRRHPYERAGRRAGLGQLPRAVRATGSRRSRSA